MFIPTAAVMVVTLATVRPATVTAARVPTDVPVADWISNGPADSSSPADQTEPRTAGDWMSSSDRGYRTPSSATPVNLVVGTADPNVYPSASGVPSARFVTRGRSIGNPFVNLDERDQGTEFDDDQYSGFTHDHGAGGRMPKWNRYYGIHKQLNKMMTTPKDSDTVDENKSAEYGNKFDVVGHGDGGGASGMGYSPGTYRYPGNGWEFGGDGGGGIFNWFNEPTAPSWHPSSSSHKMSIDVTKIGMLAMMKIVFAKLKALGSIKAMLLVLFKFKLLIFLVVMKFLMIAKFTKFVMFLPSIISLFTMPVLFSRLFRLNSLLNQQNLGSTTLDNGSSGIGMITDIINPMSITNGNNGILPANSRIRMSRLDPSEANMINNGQVIHSENCLERISCRMAGAKKPNLALVWLNWIASPLSSHIPNKKLKTFVSTFTDVTNYRLDNLYNNLLPEDWTKWCNDRYACSDDSHNSL